VRVRSATGPRLLPNRITRGRQGSPCVRGSVAGASARGGLSREKGPCRQGRAVCRRYAQLVRRSSRPPWPACFRPCTRDRSRGRGGRSPPGPRGRPPDDRGWQVRGFRFPGSPFREPLSRAPRPQGLDAGAVGRCRPRRVVGRTAQRRRAWWCCSPVSAQEPPGSVWTFAGRGLPDAVVQLAAGAATRRARQGVGPPPRLGGLHPARRPHVVVGASGFPPGPAAVFADSNNGGARPVSFVHDFPQAARSWRRGAQGVVLAGTPGGASGAASQARATGR